MGGQIDQAGIRERLAEFRQMERAAMQSRDRFSNIFNLAAEISFIRTFIRTTCHARRGNHRGNFRGTFRGNPEIPPQSRKEKRTLKQVFCVVSVLPLCFTV